MSVIGIDVTAATAELRDRTRASSLSLDAYAASTQHHARIPDMEQHEILSQSPQQWPGLTKLAFVLGERPAVPSDSTTVSDSDEMIDRLHQTLEILARVELHADALCAHARSTPEPDALQLAVELRRLAHRLQAVGDVLSNHGETVLELENRILAELDDRYRAASSRRVA